MKIAIILGVFCIAISYEAMMPVFKSYFDREDTALVKRKLFQGMKKIIAYSMAMSAFVATVFVVAGVYKNGVVFGAEMPEMLEMLEINIGTKTEESQSVTAFGKTDLAGERTAGSIGDSAMPGTGAELCAVEITAKEDTIGKTVFAEKTASVEEAAPNTVMVDLAPALTQEIEAEKPADVFTQYICNGVLEAEEGANISLYEAVKCNYGTLPVAVRGAFEDAGWRVVVVGSSLGPRYGSGSVLGLTDVSEKTIYIDNRENACNTLLHEMGHFVDLNFVYSGTPEFQEIWSREAENMGNSWTTNSANIANSTEYFAEAFEAYCLSPAALYLSCPDTYMYLDSMIIF